MALALACPLIAPVSLIYFLVFEPMLRWNLVFVYRPNHDGGGKRWPLIFHILISAMIVGQVSSIMIGPSSLFQHLADILTSLDYV
jgi:hypothetical protein